MALIKLKPTSAGRRHAVKVVNPELHKGKPFAALVEKKNRGSGRNNFGRITVRHQGGGHKKAYRIIDFKRDKDGIPAIVERLEYDPNRSANIALIEYEDGERRYSNERNGGADANLCAHLGAGSLVERIAHGERGGGVLAHRRILTFLSM